MTFRDIEALQDGFTSIGIAGNDFAIYLDGECVYRHMTGLRNVEEGLPVQRDTLYRMFSMTKPITCAAALQLYEKGKFLLNDPVSDYLPEYASLRVGDKTAERPMQVQHLFEMTAGLDYELHAPELDQLARDTGMRYTTREFARALAARPLSFESGTHWQYSLCHDVLGALIEVWSGVTFGEYLAKDLFEPLGMKSAYFHTGHEDENRLCRRYGLHDGAFRRADEVNEYQLSPLFESGGAGLTMTLDDYARFACAMTNRGLSKDGVRILAGRTVDLMRTNRLHEVAYNDMFRSNPGREGYGWGLGVRTLVDRAASGSPSLPGEFGWGGAWGTYVLMDPETRVTLVYAEQGEDPKSAYIQRRLRNAAYAALEHEGLLK